MVPWASDFYCFAVEHLHEVSSDDFALLFRIGHPLEVIEEFLTGIHPNNMEPQTFVGVHHLGELIFPQHAMIDENASETVTDGAIEQCGADGRVHSPTKTEDDAVVAQLFLEFRDGGFHKRSRTPLSPASTDIDDEIFQQEFSLCGVIHFGMELHSPNWQVVVSVCRMLHVGC